ncbi:MAG: TlpA family protein disulfide reductase [Deltaproteobacteria bacterium]|nr:TlpA family protein disulfide reductase [Deltaproteobacteria bacterium]MCW5808121.1 TlpA family protein disulfide reductase [Deltaproteobacteria bacterium]
MSNSTKALLGLLLAGSVGMVIFLFVHFTNNPNQPVSIGGKSANAGCANGAQDCLPDVSYVDTHGTTYSPKDLAGKVVMINFWATWCPPCKKEIPDLSRAWEKYKDKGLVLLGVMMDDVDANTLVNFQSDYEMLYPVVRGTREIDGAYGRPKNYPTTFIFDRTGRLVFSEPGGLSDRKLAQILEPLL